MLTDAEAATGRSTDADVIRRSLDEPAAFADLFDRHADGVHGYLAWRLGREAADDLLAETFALAFQHRRRYDVARADARPWLFGIATNLVGRHRRQEARRLRALARCEPPRGEEDAAERVIARLSADAVRPQLAAAIARLPVRYRDVLLLHAWAELNHQEIATALGVPAGTVRSRLSRARARLRAVLTIEDEG